MKKAKREREYLPILIAILVMILVTAGTGMSVWYYMNQQAQRDEKTADETIQNLQNQINELRTQSDRPSGLATSSLSTKDWKTYESKVYNFSFKYPASGYTATGSKADKNSPKYILYSVSLGKDSLKNGYEYPGELGVQIWDANGMTDFQKWIDQRDELGNNRLINYRNGSIRQTANAGVFKYVFWDDGMATYTDYAVIKNNKVYIISTINEDDETVKAAIGSFSIK